MIRLKNDREDARIRLAGCGYQVCRETGRMRLIDKDRLLLEIDRGIKAFNGEEGYEGYPPISTMGDIIDSIRYADEVEISIEKDPSEKYSLAGISSDPFSVIGYVQSAMKQESTPQEIIDRYAKDALSGDYNRLIMASVKVLESLNAPYREGDIRNCSDSAACPSTTST